MAPLSLSHCLTVLIIDKSLNSLAEICCVDFSLTSFDFFCEVSE
jgi:hypothetical protein